MIQPGDEILITAKVEAIHGQDLLVNVAGHNIQISDENIRLAIPDDAGYRIPVKDGLPYVIGEDFKLKP